jgi:uncharacterized protein YrrD
MPLLKSEQYYPDYQNTAISDGFDIDDLKNFSVYTEGDDKAGSICDILVDAQDGRMRYFVVDTGFWVFGKKVLLPIGRANIDYNDKRLYVSSMTKEQVENLPNFDEVENLPITTMKSKYGMSIVRSIRHRD